jgi:hypothetical protein
MKCHISQGVVVDQISFWDTLGNVTSLTTNSRTRNTYLFLDLTTRDPSINKDKNSAKYWSKPIALWGISWWDRSHWRSWLIVGHPSVDMRGVRTNLSLTWYWTRKSSENLPILYRHIPSDCLYKKWSPSKKLELHRQKP